MCIFHKNRACELNVPFSWQQRAPANLYPHAVGYVRFPGFTELLSNHAYGLYVVYLFPGNTDSCHPKPACCFLCNFFLAAQSSFQLAPSWCMFCTFFLAASSCQPAPACDCLLWAWPMPTNMYLSWNRWAPSNPSLHVMYLFPGSIELSSNHHRMM